MTSTAAATTPPRRRIPKEPMQLGTMSPFAMVGWMQNLASENTKSYGGGFIALRRHHDDCAGSD